MSCTQKLPRVALVSLALNAGLIALLFFVGRGDSPAENPASISSHESAVRKGAEDGYTNRQARVSTRDSGATDWLESLRQSNLPRHVFIAAIQADFDEKWNQRDGDLQKRYTNGEVEIEDLALLNVDREIALEAAMREALGEGAFREWDRKRKFSDINTAALALGDDEAEKLHSMRTALTDRLRALERSKLKKEIDPATYEERYELAQADYEQELRNLVGFKRFNEAKDSGIPAYLRRDLRGLGVSETQFTQIQEIEGTFGDGRADLQTAAQHGSIDSVKLDQEQEAITQLRDEQLQQILGEKAYALYRKQQDPRYQTMTDFAKSWQLTDQNVETVFELLLAHETETRRTKLAAYAAGLAPEETEKKVSSLAARLSESLRQLLSPAQAERLRLNGIIHP